MVNSDLTGATVIALCGKGGVGKTSISAMIVKLLIRDPDKKVLAIDADPAVGLAAALGMEVNKSVDDIRNDLIARVKAGERQSPGDTVSWLDYEMFSALTEKGNLAFLAIGRPEKEGCYCQVNHILKDIIASLAGHFDYVVIDGEAGVEQVNRRVMETVTHLILVSDASQKGLKVASTIKKVAGDAIRYKSAGLIVNRVREELNRLPLDLYTLGLVEEDDSIRVADIAGHSILDTPCSKAMGQVQTCLNSIGIHSTLKEYHGCDRRSETITMNP